MISVRIAKPEELLLCIAIREQVFVQGQGVPRALEVDGLDPDCVHFLAERGGEPMGTARLREPGVAKAERVAVRADHRGQGVGAALMAALESEAAARGHQEVILGAQVQVIAFYERLGYQAFGKVFLDAGIDHRWMRKQLSGT